jgi:hypothetical protein
MDHDPEKARLLERYRSLKQKKEAALRSHHCSKCGMRWSVGGSYCCLECGTTYGSCCVGDLARTVHDVTIPFDGDVAILRYRCGCGGRVG